MTRLTELEDASPTVLVRVFPSLSAWTEKGADSFLERVEGLLVKKSVVSIGLSGGKTPIPFFRAVSNKIASWPEETKSRIRWFFSDERCVPPESDQSNYRMARETLLIPGKIQEKSVFRIQGENPHPEREALRYEKVLAEALGTPLPHPPALDIALLGVGPDGHTASLFPGTSPEEDRHRVVLAVPPVPGRIARISLSYRTLAEAGARIFLVTGKEKHDILATVLNPQGNLPTQWVLKEAEVRLHPSEFWIDQEACPQGISQWADVRMEEGPPAPESAFPR